MAASDLKLESTALPFTRYCKLSLFKYYLSTAAQTHPHKKSRFLYKKTQPPKTLSRYGADLFLIQEYNLLDSLSGNGAFAEDDVGRLLGAALASMSQLFQLE